MPRAKNTNLTYGNLGGSCVHLCVDMQRMFAEDTEWRMPWLPRILPNVIEITRAFPERTIFTRFIPERKPGNGHGTWKIYYEKWKSMTLEHLDPALIDLVPALAQFSPPAEISDKQVYSPWSGTSLHQRLQQRNTDTLVVTGGETDVCVLATVMGAVDLGYRVVIATDALCSSTDETHDAILDIYHRRYGTQIETVTTQTILDHWT